MLHWFRRGGLQFQHLGQLVLLYHPFIDQFQKFAHMYIEGGQKHLILYENCQLVNGQVRSAIYDLTRNDLYLIPISFGKVLEMSKYKTCDEMLELVSDKLIYKEYTEYIIQNELGFICDKDELYNFPSLSLEYDSPYKITNIIWDVDDESDLERVTSSIISAGCEHLQMRVYCSTKDLIVPIDYLLEKFNGSTIKTIDLFIKQTDAIYEMEYEKLLQSFQRLNFICCYRSEHMSVKVILPYCNKYITTIEDISSELHCGQIAYEYFAINIESYSESQIRNSCLHRKVSIDRKGYIRNCPSMTESFGNIRDTALLDAIERPGFRKYWNISKDNINVCMDCEFRYACTDCRAYIEEPEDILSKPLKCGYNPYTGEWSEWSTNPLKQKAIKYYGMEELVAEHQEKLRMEGSEEAPDEGK